MTTIEVGRRWPLGRIEEGIRYTYEAGGHWLVACLRAPSALEVIDYRSGRVEIAAGLIGDIVVTAWNIGQAGPWVDAPYSIHLVSPERREVPPVDVPGSPILTIVLVDEGTQMVRVLRALTLGEGFGHDLHQLIRLQAGLPAPSQSAYDRQLARLYAEHPTSESLLSKCVARWASA